MSTLDGHLELSRVYVAEGGNYTNPIPFRAADQFLVRPLSDLS